jgi:hypothetical protein
VLAKMEQPHNKAVTSCPQKNASAGNCESLKAESHQRLNLSRGPLNQNRWQAITRQALASNAMAGRDRYGPVDPQHHHWLALIVGGPGTTTQQKGAPGPFAAPLLWNYFANNAHESR